MSKVAPGQQNGKTLYDLPVFARLYVSSHQISSHQDVHTEDLAEAFRNFMGLPPFPKFEDLERLCRQLNIELDQLPGNSGPPGVNATVGDSHSIFLRRDLPKHFTESTLGHELREVIERALVLATPGYEGIDTSDNKKMHGESEFFALCLLMQAKATHERLQELGFDVVRFATERGRSLPSVIKRVQSVYAKGSSWAGPVGGLWSFEGSRGACRVKHSASLQGFSINKKGGAYARQANRFFPSPGSRLVDFPPASLAFDRLQPVCDEVRLGDFFDAERYVVIAEPLASARRTYRVFVTAIREDYRDAIAPLMERLRLLVTA